MRGDNFTSRKGKIWAIVFLMRSNLIYNHCRSTAGATADSMVTTGLFPDFFQPRSFTEWKETWFLFTLYWIVAATQRNTAATTWILNFLSSVQPQL